MAKTIVFPTDFSTANDSAFRHAETLAKSSGVRLLIIHVEEPELKDSPANGTSATITELMSGS